MYLRPSKMSRLPGRQRYHRPGNSQLRLIIFFEPPAMARAGGLLLPELLTHALGVRRLLHHAGAVAVVVNDSLFKTGVDFSDFHI